MTSQLTRRSWFSEERQGSRCFGFAGFIAACGGSSGGGGAAATDELRDNLRFANWPLYIDYDEATKKYPTLDAFTATRESRSTTPRRSTTTPSTSGRSRAPCRRAAGSTATSSS